MNNKKAYFIIIFFLLSIILSITFLFCGWIIPGLICFVVVLLIKYLFYHEYKFRYYGLLYFILIVIALLVGTMKSCDSSAVNLKKIEGLNIIELDGIKCYDYIEYNDIDTLNKISFYDVKHYSLINKESYLAGYEWIYQNEEGFNLYLEYDSYNPKKIKNAYFENDKIIPLVKDGIVYMNVYKYIQLHSYLYTFDISDKECIEYKRIRDFDIVSVDDLKVYGLSDYKMNKLIMFEKYIPLSEVACITKENNNKYSLEFKKSDIMFSGFSSGRKTYFLKYNDDNTIDFYDSNNQMIIDNDNVDLNYYYVEQIHIGYIKRVYRDIISEYILMDINMSDFKISHSYENGYHIFNREYLAGQNKVNSYMKIAINKDDSIKIIDVVYGEQNIYHED